MEKEVVEEAAKVATASPALTATIGTAFAAAVGWLLNKLWRSHRHEIVDMKQTATRLAEVVEKKAEKTETANCLRHIEELYRNAEKDRALTRDLHEKAMGQIQSNQTQLIQILARRN